VKAVGISEHLVPSLCLPDFDILLNFTQSHKPDLSCLAASKSTPLKMVTGLRRVFFTTHPSPFCTSPSPIQQLHSSLLGARYTANSLWSSSFSRFFSAGHEQSNSPEDFEEKLKQDEALKRAKIIARQKRSNELQRHKLATDPEFLRNFRRKKRAHDYIYRQRVDRTPYYQIAAERERQRAQSDPAYALSRAISLWIRKHQWIRESLPWKTHLPIFYPEKVNHECSKCLVTRHGGAMLWWQKKRAGPDQNESYECHRCHFTGFDKLPEGYEDIPRVAYSALQARKIELDGPGSIPEPRKHTKKTTTAKKT
jgi:hypothetical protein